MLELKIFLERLKFHNINPLGLSVAFSLQIPQTINYYHLIESELQHRMVMAGWPKFKKEEIDLETFFKKTEIIGKYYIYILVENSDSEKIITLSPINLDNLKENRIDKGFSFDNIDFYMKTIIL